MSSAATEIPGYVAGTWTIDPIHSEVGFSVRHMMVSKVRGKFEKVDGTFTTAPDPLQSTVHAVIDASSITTHQNDRDNHVRSEDFLHVEKHPTITFDSTGVTADGDDFLLEGNLTIRDVTRPVTLKLELNGFGPDPFGGTRTGFSAKGEISRKDFGVNFNGVIPGTNGAVVSDKVTLDLEVEGVLQK
ncbi:MAG: YceI family protein [Streptosporangiaceae bacterium]